MLAALVEIPFYEQLRKADPAAYQALAAALDRAVAGCLTLRWEKHGRFLYAFPPEPEPGPTAALERLADLRRSLEDAGAYSPTCLVFESAVDEVASVREADTHLVSLEAAAGEASAWGEAVLIHQDALPGLEGAVVSGTGEYRRLDRVKTSSPARPTPSVAQGPAAPFRPNLTSRIVEAAFSALQDEAPRRPILVVGPDGAGKTRAVQDAARLIVGEAAIADVLTIHPLYNRKSAIHPFLNSLRTEHFALVPRYLWSWEREVWSAKRGLVAMLAGGDLENDEVGGPGMCPDRVSADFSSAYRLYLLSYVRRMAERGVPALVILENLHAYHPEALGLCVSLVADMKAYPSFVAVVTCRSGHDAAAVFGTEVTGVSAHPVTLEEIRNAAGAAYPGARLPEKIVRRIRTLSGAQPLSIRHCLRHLERTGKIERRDDGWAWVTGIPARLPSTATAGAWEEIEALPVPARRLLYLCGLAGGILSARGLVDLALALPSEGQGADAEGVTAALGLLADAGLIRSVREPYPLQPRLKTRLAGELGDWARTAREVFTDRLVSSWRSGGARRLVLIFSVLRTERPEVALDVLAAVVTQKLDELNVRGCHFFLDPAKLRVAETPGLDLARFGRLARMGELRSALLQGAWQRAEEAMDAVTNLEIPDGATAELGQLSLEQARFHLVKGDSPAAAKAAKTAVIRHHETGDEASERRAETELGAALLAEGRLEEAGEYFGFVVRSGASPAFARVRASALGGVASYLQGNYSASIRMVEAGIRVAAEAGRREWEAFLLFLRARQRFDLGLFEEAIVGLEKLHGFARAYGMQRASLVAAAWRARCLCHIGDHVQAERLWERLGDGDETLFFHAEGLYRKGNVPAALEVLAPAETARRRSTMESGERISWESGHASVEERCVALRREGGTISRLVRGFRAYLTALDGRPEPAMRELHRITREERVSDLDPYLPLYSYWYAATLPEEGGQGTDHKLTILNRAMKHLQQRSSRIENARDRSQLMSANYWNARLLEEGRARHLV